MASCTFTEQSSSAYLSSGWSVWWWPWGNGLRRVWLKRQSDQTPSWSVSEAPPTWTYRLHPAGLATATLAQMQIMKSDETDASKKPNTCAEHIKSWPDISIPLALFVSISLCARRRRCNIVVLSPSDDVYYHWLMVIGAAVFYNWTLLVVRLGTNDSCSSFCSADLYHHNGHVLWFSALYDNVYPV